MHLAQLMLYSCRQVLGVYVILGNKTTTNKTNKPCFKIYEVGVHPSHITAGRHSEEEESWALDKTTVFHFLDQDLNSFPWASLWGKAIRSESCFDCMGIKEDGATSLHRPFLRHPRKRKEREKMWNVLESRGKAKIGLLSDFPCCL